MQPTLKFTLYFQRNVQYCYYIHWLSTNLEKKKKKISFAISEIQK